MEGLKQVRKVTKMPLSRQSKLVTTTKFTGLPTNVTCKTEPIKKVFASDSEGEDEEIGDKILANVPMPFSAKNIRPSTSSFSSGHQGQGHIRTYNQASMLKPQSNAHTPLHHQSSSSSQSLHQQQQQRKRSLDSNSIPMSSSSSVAGIRIKAPPLSPLAGHGQSQALCALNSSQANEFEGDYSSGAHVNQMLSKLGADLQQKVRAKRQRLEEYFKNVKSAPGITLASRQRHIEQRNKLVEDLRSETAKLTERLDSIIQLQAVNQDKHAKMMLSLTRGSEQVRLAICDCTKAQSNLYEKFTEELKNLEDQQENGTKELMERCESTLIDLQTKIASEQMKSETESLFKLKFI